jgi:hypothetical protein
MIMKRTPRPAALLSVLCATLMAGQLCHAQTSKPTTASPVFTPAIEGQKLVLAELSRILQQEKVMLSDGAVQLALETLLSDEQKQADGIRELGKRTPLGSGAEQLSEQDRAERARLADSQDVFTDRYRRLEKGMETKAAAKPDSVYASLLSKASESQLSQTLTEAGKQVRANQLGNGMRSTNKAVEILKEMVAIVSQKAGNTKNTNDANAKLSFVPPSLVQKAPSDRLAEFAFTGSSADPLGNILRAVRLLEELAERQRKVASAARSLAATKKTAPDLFKEETDIRRQALETGTKLAALDPQIDQLIRKATASIDKAMPGMEEGPLLGAVEPAAVAAQDLEAAAEYVRKLWKDILARLKLYTQQAQASVAAGQGVPHGPTKAQMEQIQQMVMMLLRATGVLTEAIDGQTKLIERTGAAPADTDLPPLKPEQEALGKTLTEDLMSLDLSAVHVPRDALPNGVSETVNPVGDLLKDAVDRMEKASVALAKPDRADAKKRQNESLEAMNTALDLMVKVLQRLLGQMAPTAITPSAGSGAGMVLDPSGGRRLAGTYTFGLTSQQQESVRQAFRETFPRRYDRAIKLYYQSIAQDKEAKAKP